MEKTNPKTKLAKDSLEKAKKPFFRDVAKAIAKPSRQIVEVNVSKLDSLCKEGESVAIPGKVLASGEISKSVNVYALGFSVQARQKIEKAGGKCLTLGELAKSGKAARIIK